MLIEKLGGRLLRVENTYVAAQVRSDGGGVGGGSVCVGGGDKVARTYRAPIGFAVVGELPPAPVQRPEELVLEVVFRRISVIVNIQIHRRVIMQGVPPAGNFGMGNTVLHVRPYVYLAPVNGAGGYDGKTEGVVLYRSHPPADDFVHVILQRNPDDVAIMAHLQHCEARCHHAAGPDGYLDQRGVEAVLIESYMAAVAHDKVFAGVVIVPVDTVLVGVPARVAVVAGVGHLLVPPHPVEVPAFARLEAEEEQVARLNVERLAEVVIRIAGSI